MWAERGIAMEYEELIKMLTEKEGLDYNLFYVNGDNEICFSFIEGYDATKEMKLLHQRLDEYIKNKLYDAYDVGRLAGGS